MISDFSINGCRKWIPQWFQRQQSLSLNCYPTSALRAKGGELQHPRSESEFAQPGKLRGWKALAKSFPAPRVFQGWNCTEKTPSWWKNKGCLWNTWLHIPAPPPPAISVIFGSSAGGAQLKCGFHCSTCWQIPSRGVFSLPGVMARGGQSVRKQENQSCEPL